MAERQINYIKISELIQAGALSSAEQIIEQINNLVLTNQDRETFSNDIATRLIHLAIELSQFTEFNLSTLSQKLDVTQENHTRLRTILLTTGIFDISSDSGQNVMYCSSIMRNFFRQLKNNDSNLEIFQNDQVRKLWIIPGQHSQIGTIDPTDSRSLYRIYLMERDKQFQTWVENSPSKDIEELIKSWTTAPQLFDNTRLSKMYGIYGSPKLANRQEVGELQGGTFFYRPYRESVQSIRKNDQVLQEIQRISGAFFDGRRLVEVSYFKRPYGEDKHIAAGVRQALTREYIPTKSQAKKIESSITGHNLLEKLNKSDRIFVSFIQPANVDSKRIAERVGMEIAGTIEHIIEGEREIVEVWILNRKKLDFILFQQEEFRNGLLSQRGKVLEKRKTLKNRITV